MQQVEQLGGIIIRLYIYTMCKTIAHFETKENKYDSLKVTHACRNLWPHNKTHNKILYGPRWKKMLI
jgi:hypothetical protein